MTSLVPAEAPGTGLAAPLAGLPAPVMSDDEIQRTYRVAQALAASNLYKDVQSAERGFAKLLIGRTLGLNEHQSLSLHAMEGKVEVPYPLLANFVRSREGYDYRPAWIKQDGDQRVAVWLDEEEIVDAREVVGAAVEFTVGGKRRGVSTFTREDAERAGLLKPNSNHAKFPRNMWLGRALSNGIKWLVPEVAAGVPVYAEGELPRRGGDVSAPDGDGGEPGWGDVPIAAAHEAEKVARRAARLGHPGLAERATMQVVLRGQPAGFVRAKLQEWSDELDAFARTRGEPEPDAEVMCAAPDPVREGVTCERPDGHPPPHHGEGMTWDSFSPGTDTLGGPELTPGAGESEHGADEAAAEAGWAGAPDGEAMAPVGEPRQGNPSEVTDAMRGLEAEAVIEDELGPATPEQLDAEIAGAEARVSTAQTEAEHEAASAELAHLRELRAGAEPGQDRLL